jgi:hypothetical protein
MFGLKSAQEYEAMQQEDKPKRAYKGDCVGFLQCSCKIRPDKNVTKE